jgi:hypothetical protein
LIFNLQVTGSIHKTGKNLFALAPLELLKLSQIDPWFSPLDPTAAACSPAARWGTGRKTSGREMKLGSPAIDWWQWFGRGGHRRAAAAAQRRCGRGSSDGGEERGDAQQCVAPEASMWPREDARQVSGFGGSAEGRARQWRSGGGRGSSGSSDRAARLDQQVTREGLVVHKEELRGFWG